MAKKSRSHGFYSNACQHNTPAHVKNASFAGDFLAGDLLDRPLSRLGDVNGAMTR
jgi:hypothetical protein